MTTDLPVWCARCATSPARRATHRVTGPGRSEVVCDQHLPASLKWVGHSGTTELLPGHDPPPEQTALF